MKIQDVVNYVNAGPTVMKLRRPQAGHEGANENVLMAKAKKDVLGWIRDVDRLDFTADRVTEIISVGGKVSLVLGDPADDLVVVLSRPTGVGVTSWNESRNALDDLEDISGETEIVRLLDEAIEAVPGASAPMSKWTFCLVSDIDGVELVPAGILMQSDEGSVRFHAFTGFEGSATKWGGAPLDGRIESAGSYAGRTEVVSAPETVRAADYGSAVQRAMMRVASEHYQDSGKKVYSA